LRASAADVWLGVGGKAHSAHPHAGALPQKWKEVLSAEEYYVLRQKGTEPPRTGEYDKHFEEGTYNCRGCGTPLYT